MAVKKKSVKVEPEVTVVVDPVAKIKKKAAEKVPAKKKSVKAEPKVEVMAEPAGRAKKVAAVKANVACKDTEQPCNVTEGSSVPDRKKSEKPSPMRERHEKIAQLYKTYAEASKKLTHREIVRHFGCSFNTAAKLVDHHKKLTGDKETIETVISEALQNAIKLEISRNVDAHRDTISEKLEVIKDAEAALDLAIKLIEKIFNSVKNK